MTFHFEDHRLQICCQFTIHKHYTYDIAGFCIILIASDVVFGVLIPRLFQIYSMKFSIEVCS